MEYALKAREILVKAKQSMEKMSEALCLFMEFLNRIGSRDFTKYYLARNQLQEGRKLLEDTVKDAKKFLGPQSEYTSREINEMRTQLLQASRIIVQSQTYDGLEAELLADEFLKSFMCSEDVVDYLQGTGHKQTTGNRKLRNIKIRMIIDQLIQMELEALAWQQRATDKLSAKSPKDAAAK